MLLVRTEVKPSPIHGLGVFALEPIKKGQLIWEYDERIDERIREDELDTLPEAIQEFLSIYGYIEVLDGVRVVTLCGDNSRHMNHDDNPNCLGVGPVNVAAWDIGVGEELTCDYYSFDPEAAAKINSSKG